MRRMEIYCQHTTAIRMMVKMERTMACQYPHAGRTSTTAHIFKTRLLPVRVTILSEGIALNSQI